MSVLSIADRGFFTAYKHVNVGQDPDGEHLERSKLLSPDALGIRGQRSPGVAFSDLWSTGRLGFKRWRKENFREAWRLRAPSVRIVRWKRWNSDGSRALID